MSATTESHAKAIKIETSRASTRLLRTQLVEQTARLEEVMRGMIEETHKGRD